MGPAARGVAKRQLRQPHLIVHRFHSISARRRSAPVHPARRRLDQHEFRQRIRRLAERFRAVVHRFVAYTGFNPQSKDGDKTTLAFGVPHVKFGTAYFPYSTLGENFEKWHMPGQEKTTYWTLSADTVTNYKLFTDDIKRDLRILKAIGFQSVRLHHLEMIDQLDRKVTEDYLDFFFGELKHLGLTALLDVKLPPARVAELV